MRNMPECLFDGINEAQSDPFARFLEVMFDARQNVLVSPAPPDDRFDAHLTAWRRT